MFALFKGRYYYPYGGWEDLNDVFDTLQSAIDAAGERDPYEWAHVVDLSTRKIVWHR